MRSFRTTLAFPRPFTMDGYPDELPAGAYEMLAEEELLEGLSFVAYRRTATFLSVRGSGPNAGRTELHPIQDCDLEAALGPGWKEATAHVSASHWSS